MTGTDLCANKSHQSRSYLNHLVHWENFAASELKVGGTYIYNTL